MKVGTGGLRVLIAIVGIVGGTLAIAGAFSPWIDGRGQAVDIPGIVFPLFTNPETFPAYTGYAGVWVIILGLLGLTGMILTALLPKRPIVGILAMVFGILALVIVSFSLWDIVTRPTYPGFVALSYGLFIGLTGSALLLLGGPLAYVHGTRAMAQAMPSVPAAGPA